MHWVDELFHEVLNSRPTVKYMYETDARKYQKLVSTAAVLVDVARSMQDAGVYHDVARQIIQDSLHRLVI